MVTSSNLVMSPSYQSIVEIEGIIAVVWRALDWSKVILEGLGNLVIDIPTYGSYKG